VEEQLLSERLTNILPQITNEDTKQELTNIIEELKEEEESVKLLLELTASFMGLLPALTDSYEEILSTTKEATKTMSKRYREVPEPLIFDL
jgi:ABC-type phosphate/phosphonate transport system substrate-binding protein